MEFCLQKGTKALDEVQKPLTEFIQWGLWKWVALCWQHSQIHFLEWKLLLFDSYITEFFFKGPTNDKPAFVLTNGCQQEGYKPIIWTNDGLAYWHTLMHYWTFYMNKHVKHVLTSLNFALTYLPYMRQWIGSALVQIMACRLFGTKPLSKPMLGYCQFYP